MTLEIQMAGSVRREALETLETLQLFLILLH